MKFAIRIYSLDHFEFVKSELEKINIKSDNLVRGDGWWYYPKYIEVHDTMYVPCDYVLPSLRLVSTDYLFTDLNVPTATKKRTCNPTSKARIFVIHTTMKLTQEEEHLLLKHFSFILDYHLADHVRVKHSSIDKFEIIEI